MGKKLYVGNLTYGVSDSTLEQLFSQFGTVQSAQVIQDRVRAGARVSALSKWTPRPRPRQPSTGCTIKSTMAGASP